MTRTKYVEKDAAIDAAYKRARAGVPIPEAAIKVLKSTSDEVIFEFAISGLGADVGARFHLDRRNANGHEGKHQSAGEHGSVRAGKTLALVAENFDWERVRYTAVDGIERSTADFSETDWLALADGQEKQADTRFKVAQFARKGFQMTRGTGKTLRELGPEALDSMRELYLTLGLS